MRCWRIRSSIRAWYMIFPYKKRSLDGILDLLTETMLSSKSEIRVGGELRPAQIVKNRLMRLTGEHIRYVLYAMEENTTDVKNIRQVFTDCPL